MHQLGSDFERSRKAKDLYLRYFGPGQLPDLRGVDTEAVADLLFYAVTIGVPVFQDSELRCRDVEALKALAAATFTVISHTSDGST